MYFPSPPCRSDDRPTVAAVSQGIILVPRPPEEEGKKGKHPPLCFPNENERKEKGTKSPATQLAPPPPPPPFRKIYFPLLPASPPSFPVLRKGKGKNTSFFFQVASWIYRKLFSFSLRFRLMRTVQ